MSSSDLSKFAKVSTEVLTILDLQLSTISDEKDISQNGFVTPVHDQILFYKMKADAHRYLAELAPTNYRDRVSNQFPADSTVEADCALSAYKIASGMAQEHLEACHPLRLMLAYNFSTFYADIHHSIRMANHMAKTAYENACEIVHMLSGQQYKDAIHVLQLIRDNISAWSLQLATRESYNEESDVDVDEDWEPEEDLSSTDHSIMVIGGSPEASPHSPIPVSSPVTFGDIARNHQQHHLSPPSSPNQLSPGREMTMGAAMMKTMMNPSASAPVLVKGHGGRALRPNSDVSDSRPDSAPRTKHIVRSSHSNSVLSVSSPNRSRSNSSVSSPASSRPGSPSRSSTKKRRKSLSNLTEGSVPSDHIESLLRGAEDITVDELEQLAKIEDDKMTSDSIASNKNNVSSSSSSSSSSSKNGVGGGGGQRLGRVLFELFHSYLEGEVGTPVATNLSDGTTKTLKTAILQASKSTGLRLTTSALCRLLRDFQVVPKLINEQTVQTLVNMVALSNTEGEKGQPVVLSYTSKYNLHAKGRKKRPKWIDIVKVNNKTINGGSGSGDANKKSNFGIRRRPSSGGSNAGKSKRPNVYNIDFYEFVDVMGRIGILCYKLNIGGIKNAPRNINKFNAIINAFFRYQMFLFGEQTLEKEAEWRKIVKRPWEAYEKHKRMASPKAIMRPPLPGNPVKLLDRVALKGKVHVLPQTKDPRMPQFKLTKTGYKELHSKLWTRSLKQIFDFYRKINTVIKKQKVISSSSGGDLFSDIVGMNNIITLADFIKFLSDFKICPQILHKDLCREIFLVSVRNSSNNNNSTVGISSDNVGSSSPSSSRSSFKRPGSANRLKKRDGSQNNIDMKQSNRPTSAPLQKINLDNWHLMGATFDAFLDCIGRIAIASDISEPVKYVGDVEKIVGFMILLELDEAGDWRKKMRSYGSPPRSSKMIRDSMTRKNKNRVPLVRIGASGSPARGAGMRAVRATTNDSF